MQNRNNSLNGSNSVNSSQFRSFINQSESPSGRKKDLTEPVLIDNQKQEEFKK